MPRLRVAGFVTCRSELFNTTAASAPQQLRGHLGRLRCVTSEALVGERVRAAVSRRLACLLSPTAHAHRKADFLGGYRPVRARVTLEGKARAAAQAFFDAHHELFCAAARGIKSPPLGSHCLPPFADEARDAQDSPAVGTA